MAVVAAAVVVGVVVVAWVLLQLLRKSISTWSVSSLNYPLRARNFARRRSWRLSLGVDSRQFLTFRFCLIFGHLNIALFSHASFRYCVNRLASLIFLLHLSKANREISLKLLGENRIASSPLPIKAKPNHFRLWLREFISAAS
jgi:hypothetical protein